MAGESTRSSRIKTESVAEVKFKCRICGKEKPISQMKVITRFRPVVVVCEECESGLR